VNDEVWQYGDTYCLRYLELDKNPYTGGVFLIKNMILKAFALGTAIAACVLNHSTKGS